MSTEPTFEVLDDLRGTGACEVVSKSGTVAKFYVDGRWRNEKGAIVPLDAAGHWRIVKRHKDGM